MIGRLRRSFGELLGGVCVSGMLFLPKLSSPADVWLDSSRMFDSWFSVVCAIHDSVIVFRSGEVASIVEPATVTGGLPMLSNPDGNSFDSTGHTFLGGRTRAAGLKQT